MIGHLGYASFHALYTVMLIGTFIETGARVLQGINEPVDGYLEDSGIPTLSPTSRAMIAVSAILVSAGLSLIGITDLIAKGYGTLAWGFLAVYVIPLMTVGVYKLSVLHRTH
mgnify:FL=1